MSESSKAVFLSYASQDAAAVLRIAEALRASGVEVWFDRDELVGGDAWDAKIRGQIASCALFVPVISAATQARREGYFRIEWKLAAQRTHAMADGTPFLLPVVIDETRDAEALVPAEFRAVQWTRMAGGDAGALDKFCARVGKLLGGDGRDASPRRPSSEVDNSPGRLGETSLPKRRFPWLVAGAVTLSGVAAMFVSQPWRIAATASVPAPGVKLATNSEVETLLSKINAIIDKEADCTREDWALAEAMGEKAVRIDPSNVTAWAFYANAASGLYEFYRDRDGRFPFADAQVRAQKALSLSSESDEAKFALANCYRLRSATRDEAEQIFAELVRRRPNDRRVLRGLAGILRTKDGGDDLLVEAISLYDRAILQPGSDPVALREKAAALVDLGRFREAGEVLDKSLELRNGPAAMARKINHLLVIEGDIAKACELVEKLPGSYNLREDILEYSVRAWLWAGNARKCLNLLNGTTVDWVHDEPRSFLIGQAMRLAGRPEPARIAWQQSLKLAEREIGATGSEFFLATNVRWKTLSLALLGETIGADAALQTYRQTVGRPNPRSEYNLALILSALHRGEEAIEALERAVLARPRTSFDGRNWGLLRRASLRFDPIWEAVRANPRFQALLEKMFEDPRFPRLKATVPTQEKATPGHMADKSNVAPLKKDAEPKK